MGADQPSRMWTRKFIKRDLPLRMAAKLATAGLADVNFPGVRRVKTVSPASKALRCARITGCGSALSGLVSMAVTNMAAGAVSGAGIC